MSKRRTNLKFAKEPRDRPTLVPVQIPLPMLVALQSARQSLVDLCILAGQEVLRGAMEEDRAVLCGPKGKHAPQRQALRWGSTPSEVTLGGRRVPMRRPRVRSVEGEELSLPWFEWAADRDPLDERTLEQIAVGVSTRKYVRSLERLPAGMSQRAVSKSAVSRRFVALSAAQLRKWLARPIRDLKLRVVMIDGIDFRDRILLIALGIAADGTKSVLGLREGTTENATVCRSLLRDLISRGLPADQALLFVIDGGKGIRKAIAETYGRLALVQRCQVHKKGNVLEHLPEERQAQMDRILNEIYLETKGVELARRRLVQLASSLEEDYPSAAASIREGLDETLTLRRLGIDGALYRTFRSTNPIENLNGSVARYTRNVCRWRNGLMILRWVAFALTEAEKGFRRVKGYRDMEKLVAALDRHQREIELDTEVAAA